ncbi:hypothetical protein T4B_4585, partial [Trichinella pseudospiralis]
LLIDRSIEKEEFSTDFVASTGNYCRVMERALKIRQRNHIL